MMKCSSLEEIAYTNSLAISYMIYYPALFHKNIGRALITNHFPVFHHAENGHGIVRSTFIK